MHEPIKEGLEDFLRDDGDPEFAAHLEACRECRGQVERMREQALALRLLRAERESDPAPGFYARVLARIEAQRRPSLWSLLLEPAFGRRLMYASLTLVVFLGTYLIATESGEPVTASTPAEQYLAEEHPAVGANPQQDRDLVLVRLATYTE
jgi:anti-sigma factor RsiW